MKTERGRDYIVTATAPGARHVNPGQPGKINNQDAIAQAEAPNGSVIVLCDGCGSQPHSGTGADIGAHVIARVVAAGLARCRTPEQLDWDGLGDRVQGELRRAIRLFAPNDTVPAFERAVVERFLFTSLVVVVGGNGTVVVASLGDGLIVIDEEITILSPPIPNAPPYLGYLFLQESAYHANKLRSWLRFSVNATVDLRALKSGLIVGTDGLEPLIGEDLHHPALAQPKSLQRWLNAQSAERLHEGAFVPGKCPDDVSLVIIRTAEAQQRLVESRREVAGLKQETARFRERIASTEEALKRGDVPWGQSEERIAALKQELAQLAARVHGAQQPELLEAELASLTADVENLHEYLLPPPAVLTWWRFRPQLPPRRPRLVPLRRPYLPAKRVEPPEEDPVR